MNGLVAADCATCSNEMDVYKGRLGVLAIFAIFIPMEVLFPGRFGGFSMAYIPLYAPAFVRGSLGVRYTSGPMFL